MAGVCGNDKAPVTTQLDARLLPRMGPWSTPQREWDSSRGRENWEKGYCKSSRKITHQQCGSSAGIQEENLEIVPLLLKVKNK